MNERLFRPKVTVYLMTTASSTRNDRWFYHERRSHLLSLPMGSPSKQQFLRALSWLILSTLPVGGRRTQLLPGLWWQSMPGLHVPSPDTRKRAKAPKTSEQHPSTYRPLSKQYKLVVLEDIHGR